MQVDVDAHLLIGKRSTDARIEPAWDAHASKARLVRLLVQPVVRKVVRQLVRLLMPRTQLRNRTQPTRRVLPTQYGSRNWFFKILPDGLRGMASTQSTEVGHL